MPRLPTVEQLGQTPVPTVRGSVSPLDLRAPNLSHTGQAEAEFGQAMAGLGDTIGKLAQKEKMNLDTLRKTEAITQLKNGYMQLQVGDQQQGIEGFTQVLNGDASKRPLVEEYQQKRQDLKDKIREGLSSEEQKIQFDREAVVEDQGFDSKLFQHIAQQQQNYRKITFEGANESDRNIAALNYKNPGEIGMAILRTRVNTEHEARMEGLDPARPADRPVIDALQTANESKIHDVVIRTMLMNGDDASALDYFKAIQDVPGKLTPEARAQLGTMVQSSSIDGQAAAIAKKIFDTHASGDINAANNLELWFNEADASSDNPRVVAKAKELLTQKAHVRDYTQGELVHQNSATILDKFEQGVPLEQLQRDPAWMALAGTGEQAKLEEYIKNRGYTEKQRAEHDAQYEEGLLSRKGFAEYWRLSNPSVLSGMSENAILALAPTLGQRLTGELMQLKRSIVKKGPIAVQLDTDMFKLYAKKAGLDAYKTSPGPDLSEKLGRLRNHVEAVIDIAQRNIGRELYREEKEKLMEHEINQTVQTPSWLFGLAGGNKVPAAIVKPEDRGKYIIPFGDIPPEWTYAFANKLKSEGMVPQRWTPQQIYRAKQSAFEHAYAIDRTGGTLQEALTAFGVPIK